MTQNLRFSGTSISPELTNINTSKTLSWGDLTSGNSYTAARYHNSGNNTTGYWYNFAGASAMTIATNSNSNPATYDICPKGWKLPTSSELATITSSSSSFSPITGGYYSGGSATSTTSGYWWASDASSTTVRYRLQWNGSALSSTGTNNRRHGLYIRCKKLPPTMQSVDSSTLASMMPNLGDTTTLRDARDDQEYSVAKLADGQYWMTTNLNLAGGTALSADDTDVTSDYISSFSTSNNLTKTGSTIILPASSTSGFNTDNYSYVYNSGKTGTDCSSPGCYSYYSWDAAVLGSGRSITTDNTDAPYSICPKGWRLPNTRSGTDGSSDFRALAIALGGSSSISEYKNSSTSPTGSEMLSLVMASPNNFHFTGRYYAGGSFYDDSIFGYYWSSTSYDAQNSRSLCIYSYNGDIGANFASPLYRPGGSSIRCIKSS